MTPILSNLKKSGRAAVVALVLGAASLTSMPAMAQSPSFTFEFGIGGGGEGFSFGTGRRGERIRRDCLTNREIVRGLRRNGFDDIEIVRRRGNRLQIIADYGRSTYRLTVHRCTGRVTDIDRIRRGGRPRDGFGLQFNFGM
jgi:hypothetical protein